VGVAASQEQLCTMDEIINGGSSLKLFGKIRSVVSTISVRLISSGVSVYSLHQIFYAFL